MVTKVTPQSVGLEFVRQYYTILNKAPDHLHRFYNNNSSFIHGGVGRNNNEPAIGQERIHEVITSLNFKDCRAKIRTVDAHATLADGVVIQVTGELSNNGFSMRRFMQTFVLALQSPKKYYVHNDIFRYQDEVFVDNKGCEDGGSELEDEMECTTASEPSYTPSPQTTTTLNGSAHPPPEETSPPPTNHITPTQVSEPPPAITPTSVAPVTAPLSPPPATTAPAEPAPPSSPTPPAQPSSRWSGPENEGWGTIVMNDTESAWEETPTPQTEKMPDPDPPQSESINQTPIQQSNGPRTFANLFKSEGGYSSQLTSLSQPPPQSDPPKNYPPNLTSPPPSIPAPQTQHTSQSPPNNNQQNNTENNSRMNNNSSSPLSQPPNSFMKPSRPPQRPPNRDRPPYRPSFDDNSESGDRVPWGGRNTDSQQIFVGNLPHGIGEEELRGEFSRFGKIIDIRINTTKGKAVGKGTSGHTVPNFGFITFDDDISATKCLDARPILLNTDSPDKHRLNVEEKKAKRMEGGIGLGRPGSGRGGMGGNMRGGPMGGSQGRGGPRGGLYNRGGSGGGPRGGYNRR